MVWCPIATRVKGYAEKHLRTRVATLGGVLRGREVRELKMSFQPVKYRGIVSRR
jgi:hypothetical protein